jgi:hypothetical protein
MDDVMGKQMLLHKEKQCDLYSSFERVQRGLENTARKLPVPEETGDFFTNVATISFSRRIMLHGTSYW